MLNVIMLNVILVNVVMRSDIMLNGIMQCVIMLSVFMLSVVPPGVQLCVHAYSYWGRLVIMRQCYSKLVCLTMINLSNLI
jgi:hypothetical protein